MYNTINDYEELEYINLEQRIMDNGYEDVVVFRDPCYAGALIGITEDNRAVYNYDLMIEWLAEHEEIPIDEAADFVSYNTIRSLSYYGSDAPIVMYELM